MLNLHRPLLAAIGISLLSLATAGSAGAITLPADSVNGRDVFRSGGLTFTGFDFDFGDAEEEDFLLTILGTRVILSGPMQVGAGTGEFSDQYSMDFRVAAADPGMQIVGVRLVTPTSIRDNAFFPTFMEASSDFVNASNTLVSSLNNTVLDPIDVQDSAEMISEQIGLDVQAIAELQVGGSGDFVDLASIETEFALVPEPSTAALLGLGLFGLTAAGRVRRR